MRYKRDCRSISQYCHHVKFVLYYVWEKKMGSNFKTHLQGAFQLLFF